MAVAIAIFAASLAAIATERFNRTKVALVGAVLVLITQTIDQEDAIESIDFNTIGLLAGMMLMVRLTETTGIYNWLAIRAGQLSRGRPLAVVISLAMTTAVLSAFLDNLTTVLLVVPITFLLADALDIDPIPLVIIEIVVSNIGGTATLIGDPPNIIIAGATDLSFTDFIVNLAPIAVIAFVAVTAFLYAVYRPRLQTEPKARAHVMGLDARRSIEDRDELLRTVPILIATIFLFFLHKAIGLEPATVALAGATAMLLTTRQSLEDALRGIEWPTLFFFLGLFVMVGALEETGAIKEIADGISAVTDGNRTAELLGIAWVSVLGSGLVDNIPFTATMIPVVEQLQTGNGGDDAYWWALAIGACFGGNATLIAAAANVAAAGMAARAGRPIGFMTFLKAGVPATLLSMLLATAYIAVRYL
jgi:Na+/H+ antiporter NhaD/arsenite permease-like protein